MVDAIGVEGGDGGPRGDGRDGADVAAGFTPADEFGSGVGACAFAGVGEMEGDGADFKAHAMGDLGIGEAGAEVFTCEALLLGHVTDGACNFHGSNFSPKRHIAQEISDLAP